MTLLLVDGNGLACKLWWANPYEVPQRFVNTILGLCVRLSAAPSSVVVAWDAPGPTWRHEIFPRYKSNRTEKPQALKAALEECRELLNFPAIQAPGFEGDDVIATLAIAAADRGEESVILAEDKDFAQIVSARCRMVNMRGDVTTEADVERRWGVPPERMRHLLSWMGDSADNLTGVPGVGTKRAIPRALAGEVGDPMTWELVGLATVPEKSMESLCQP